jgi:ferredoxin--NADP+ reductase
MFQIVHREEMAEGTVVLNEIMAPRIATKAGPGQFIILEADEQVERIPLTMAETNKEKGTITTIFKVVGKSTALFNTQGRGFAFGYYRPSGKTSTY